MDVIRTTPALEHGEGSDHAPRLPLIVECPNSIDDVYGFLVFALTNEELGTFLESEKTKSSDERQYRQTANSEQSVSPAIVARLRTARLI